MNVAFVSRTVIASSGHRLVSKKLTEAENKALYGKCNFKNGHGHNYKITVTLKGTVNPDTGILIHTGDLKKHIEDHILSEIDHFHLNKDVPFFDDNPSTAENLCIYAWQKMAPLYPDHLYEVAVSSGTNNTASFRGERQL